MNGGPIGKALVGLAFLFSLAVYVVIMMETCK